MKVLRFSRRWCGSGATIAVLTSLLLAMPFIVAADDYVRLEGSWQCQEEGMQVSLRFQTRERLVYNGEGANYELLPKVIRVQGEYGKVDYYYEFQGGTLAILSPDGTLMHCQKAEKSRQPAQRPDQRQAPAQAMPKYEKPKGRMTGEESDPASLLYKFAGKWSHYTPNTETHIHLMPDGTYADGYESSYGGQFHDQGGYQTGAWGATGSERGRGRWTVLGNLKRGQLTLIDTEGNRIVYEYQVHMKNGEYFWGEYFFNGKLYSVDYIYR